MRMVKQKSKPFFPIGVWFEGKPEWASSPREPRAAKRYYDRSFADLAHHGLNTVVVPNCPEPLWETLLTSAGEKGIKVVLEIPSLVSFVTQGRPAQMSLIRREAIRVFNKIGKYKSLWRYQVRDEPEPTMLPNWSRVKRILAEIDPARAVFSCFANPKSLGLAVRKTTHRESVFDVYPHFVDTQPQVLGYFLPLLDQYKVKSQTAPMWVVLQTFAKPGMWRYPTSEEFEAMVWNSLAAGAKGIFFFIYQSLPRHPEQLKGLVGPNGRPTEMYRPVSKLARTLKKLSPLLVHLQPSSFSTSLEDKMMVSTFCETGNIPTFIPNTVKGDVRLGGFVDQAGRRILIAASTRPDHRVLIRLNRLKHVAAWKDEVTGKGLFAKNGIIEFTLPPGGGRILKETKR